MICQRCGDNFETHERWADVLFSKQGTGVDRFTHICPECRGELEEWLGLRPAVPEPPYSCYDERLLYD